MIESGDDYYHRIHGTVRVACVLDKHDVYNEESMTGQSSQTLVRFSANWNERGLQAPVRHQQVEEFLDDVDGA